MTEISNLTAVTDVLDDDDFVLARSGATRRITGEDLAAELGGGGSGEALVLSIAQTGHGLSVGDWIRLDGSGDYVVAQADSAANAEVVGLVIAVADANNFTVQRNGYVEAGLSGLTPGAVYYLSPSTAGEITATEPSSSGQVSKPLLVAESATTGWMSVEMRGILVPAEGGGGMYDAYARYAEIQTAGTLSGTFTAGAWQTRVLNTEVADPAGIGALASNQITLGAGTYRIRASAPGASVAFHRLRVRNVTDGETLAIGAAGYSSPSDFDQSTVIVEGPFTLLGTKSIELQHRCSTTKTTNGFGAISADWGEPEIYAEVEIWREA